MFVIESQIDQSVYVISGGYIIALTSNGVLDELMAQSVVFWLELRQTQLLLELYSVIIHIHFTHSYDLISF